MRLPVLVTVAAAACSVPAARGPAGPPPAPRTMPGDVKGEVRTRWLAPYVSVSTRSIGTSSTTIVQWFDADGRLARELAGPDVDAHPGYVDRLGNGPTTIYGVNGDWKITLPQKPGPAGYITATEDSRTFVHEFHPGEGEIAADVYVAGRLAGTVGPFLQYQGQDVQLGSDGSLALLTWKDEDKKTPQVVVAGPDGKVRFRADCEGPVLSPEPAPDGAGVLVHANAGGDARNTFTFYTKTGKGASLNVGPNAWPVAWVPGTATAVFSTSVGYDYRFHLIDWGSGTRGWDIPDPSPARVPGASPAVAVAGDYLLVGGLEDVDWGSRKLPVRGIHALDVKTGRAVAHWLPSPLQQAHDGGNFLKLGKRLFLAADEEFAEVSLDDIAAKTNGWK